MVYWVLVYLGLVIWPLGLVFRRAARFRRARVIVFVIQLVGLALGHWYWIQLVRVDNPDRLHFLPVFSVFGIGCTILQGSLLVAAVVDRSQREQAQVNFAETGPSTQSDGKGD